MMTGDAGADGIERMHERALMPEREATDYMTEIKTNDLIKSLQDYNKPSLKNPSFIDDSRASFDQVLKSHMKELRENDTVPEMKREEPAWEPERKRTGDEVNAEKKTDRETQTRKKETETAEARENRENRREDAVPAKSRDEARTEEKPRQKETAEKKTEREAGAAEGGPVPVKDVKAKHEKDLTGKSLAGRELLNILNVLGTDLQRIASKKPLQKDPDLRKSMDLLKKATDLLEKKETDVREIKTTLRELMAKLQQLSKKLEKGEVKTAPDSAFEGRIDSIKKQIRNLAEIVARHANEGEEKKDSVRVNLPATDTGQEKAALAKMPSLHQGGGNPDSSSSKDDPSMGFQFFRNGPNAKGIVPGAEPRRALFSEQLNEIIQRSQIHVKDGKNGTFSMQLYPESLGRVNVKLGLEQGVLYGKFLVDSNESRQLLLENIDVIREQLMESGISVGEFQVNVRQGGESFEGKKEREIPEYVFRDNPAVIGEYDVNASSAHEGRIDMII